MRISDWSSDVCSSDHRQVRVDGTDITGTVYDVAMEQARNRDWVLSRVALQEPGHGFRRRGQTHVMEWQEVSGVTRQQDTQAATQLLAKLTALRPTHAATTIHNLPARRRGSVVSRPDNQPPGTTET